ncbi:hypothetical protein TRICI_000584 [Trichomonascus ciferrii]|uniref:Uncharacterized protein n=1 Tax=Trichomonascus ciferrii TaxID=44093 RepID=A0A642VC42_9ASCO|nr:hypothetical protein TRICI_000584 [Trichomonascus ciferrii]
MRTSTNFHDDRSNSQYPADSSLYELIHFTAIDIRSSRLRLNAYTARPDLSFEDFNLTCGLATNYDRLIDFKLVSSGDVT